MTGRKSSADQERVLTQTLERGLKVLRAFRCETKPLRNSTIANRTSLPRPTVSRITNTLVELGYLNRIADESQYQLGTRIFSVGEAYLKATRVRAIARSIVERFVAEHGVSIGIAAPDGLQMTYILWCKEPNALTFRLGAGAILPMGWTAIGKAYLWALPPATRRSLIAQLKTHAGSRGSALSTAIQRSFRDLDNDGYCVSMAEFQKNTFGIAAPLVLDEGNTVLSVGGGGARLDISESALRRAIAPDLLRVVQVIQDAVNADGVA